MTSRIEVEINQNNLHGRVGILSICTPSSVNLAYTVYTNKMHVSKSATYVAAYIHQCLCGVYLESEKIQILSVQLKTTSV